MIVINGDRILQRLGIVEQQKFNNTKRNSVNIDSGQTYFKRILIEPGVTGYMEETVPENVLITKETIKRDLDTIIDKPVTIGHDSNEPVGKVIDVYYDSEQEGAVVGFIIWEEEAKRLLQSGQGISCTYDIEEYVNKKGTWHNIPYAREITRIAFEAIAIVEHPRYENAKDVLN